MIYLENNIEFYAENPEIKEHIDSMVDYYVKYFRQYYKLGE
jgi:hypothetical protein